MNEPNLITYLCIEEYGLPRESRHLRLDEVIDVIYVESCFSWVVVVRDVKFRVEPKGSVDSGITMFTEVTSSTCIVMDVTFVKL